MISEIVAIERIDIVNTNEVPQLPDTSTWRKVEPGETIPAGTPHMMTNENSYIISKGLVWDTEVSRYESTTYYADLPTHGPDLSLIPEGGPGSARVLRINGVVGTYYRKGSDLHVVDSEGDISFSAMLSWVESVEPVTILGEDEVAVPRKLVESAKKWLSGNGSTVETENYLVARAIVRDLATRYGRGR